MAAGKRIRLAFLMMLGHYLGFLVGGGLGTLLGLERDKVWDAPLVAFAVVLAVFAFEVYVVLHLLMQRWAKLSFRDVGWRALPTKRDLVVGVTGFALSSFLVICVIALRAGSLGEAFTYVREAIADYTPQQRVFFVLMGVVAALPEETVFRGILQPALQEKLGRTAGLVVGALIFAAYHLMFRWWQLLGKITNGLVFAVCREKSDTLWAPAIAHGLQWAVLGAL